MELPGRRKGAKPQLKSAAGFSSFYEEHAGDMLRFFMRRVGLPEVALDLTAETFAAAFIARSRFRGKSEEEAAGWLYAIARAQLAGYRRRGVSERQAIERLGIALPELSREDQDRIEEMIDAEGLGHLAQQGLAALAPGEREAIELRILEELPYGEVATQLGITQEAARARVSRGLRNLAASLPEIEATNEVKA